VVDVAPGGIATAMDASEISRLVTRIGLQDRAAFRTLYRATSAKLFGVCLRVLKNRTDAEDVLQEVYIKIWNNAASFQVSGYSPMTWLITIARNQCIDRLRLRRPDTSDLSEVESAADDAPTPEEASVRMGEAARLRHCLDQLAPDRAATVKAVYLEGYSYQEMADQLQQPINTVRTWLRRSLIRLRECLSS
jgi:RNA polymerase sigma-70 factor (ECF subfamily)